MPFIFLPIRWFLLVPGSDIFPRSCSIPSGMRQKQWPLIKVLLIFHAGDLVKLLVFLHNSFLEERNSHWFWTRMGRGCATQAWFLKIVPISMQHMNASWRNASSIRLLIDLICQLSWNFKIVKLLLFNLRWLQHDRFETKMQHLKPTASVRFCASCLFL